jgi:hypothetical protein
MKKKIKRHSRRKFFKMSAAGAGCAMLGHFTAKKVRAGTAQGTTIWEDGLQINPEIDNRRVVWCHDPEMVTGNPLSWEIEVQNESVVTEKVHENMDRMAVALANREVADPDDLAANAAEAWAAIFQKPENKEWNEVTAAIKVNSVFWNWPRLAVIAKVCTALRDLGVDTANITIYDAGEVTDGKPDYLPQFGEAYAAERLPVGVQVNNYLGGDQLVDITLPNGEVVECLAGLADGSVDILINMAVNKGHHNETVGGFTLTMKNHLGSLRFAHSRIAEENIESFAAMFKSIAILGDQPPPRQQLCIVDSIWASFDGPAGAPDRAPHCLVMGTFGPIVDWLTVKKIREEQEESDGGQPWGLGVTNTNTEMLDSFLTNFGYAEEDINEEEHWIDAFAYEPVIAAKSGRPSENIIRLTVFTGAYKPSRAVFSLKDMKQRPKIGIYTVRGRLVRILRVPADLRSNTSLEWDGKDINGVRARTGTYVVTLRAGRQEMSRRILLSG